jgi:hypothetical protein
VEMGGMFTVLKVRKDQPHGNYKDPGWYKHPKGTVAREWKGPLPSVKRHGPSGAKANPGGIEMKVRKPGGHEGH